MSSCFTGHDQLDSNTPRPTKEVKPASKPSADAAGKDASAKDASVKDASAKSTSTKVAVEEDASLKDASAKDSPAKGASAKVSPAKGASAKDSPAKGASAKVVLAKAALAKAASNKPERESSAGRGSHKASEKAADKGHLVARDSRRSDDRPTTGRSGQKRARSRYTVLYAMWHRQHQLARQYLAEYVCLLSCSLLQSLPT